MELVTPGPDHLPSYFAALWRNWSPRTSANSLDSDTITRLVADPASFLKSMDDRDGHLPAVELPDGTQVPRLPGFQRWMWDGEFAGSIDLRWQPGSQGLPDYCLGHIGYGVVPWRRNRGYATSALQQMLALAASEGLEYVEVCTDVENLASQRVIMANGAGAPQGFTKLEAFGGGACLRYRIDLGAGGPPAA